MFSLSVNCGHALSIFLQECEGGERGAGQRGGTGPLRTQRSLIKAFVDPNNSTIIATVQILHQLYLFNTSLFVFKSFKKYFLFVCSLEYTEERLNSFSIIRL